MKREDYKAEDSDDEAKAGLLEGEIGKANTFLTPPIDEQDLDGKEGPGGSPEKEPKGD